MKRRQTLTCALATLAIVLLTTTACSDSTNQGKPMPDTSEFSQLTKTGIARIQDTQHARFDLRNHELTKAAVGLEGTTMGPIIGGADQPTITLELLGPNQAETEQTSTMAFVSTGPATEPFENIVFWKSFDTIQESLAELNGDIAQWGLNPRLVKQWEENIKDGSDFQQVISMGVGRSGLVIDVEGYIKNGKPLFKYDIYLEPKYYTPEVQATIQASGRSS